MLTSLYLRNFVIVAEAELALDTGMTAITGETGAGKSLLIDALNLVLGERATIDVVGPNERQAEIIASFDIFDNQAAASWLQEQSLDADGDCVLRRVLQRDGPSRAFINGRPAVIQQLREIGDLLVDIHGQHEHQSLLRSAAQRDMLDSFAGHDETLSQLAHCYDELQDAAARLQRLQSTPAADAMQLDRLRHEVEELEQLDLAADEYSRLDEEMQRLANASDLLQGVADSLQALREDENMALEQQLQRVIGRLQSLAEYDITLAEIGSLLEQAAIQLDEAGQAMRHYLDRLDLDPERLRQVNQRMGLIHDLARKHRVSGDELPQQLASLRQQLDDAESVELRQAELENEIDRIMQNYRQLAGDISESRRQAAACLAERITANMQQLGMAGGQFDIVVEYDPQAAARRHGTDSIEFRVAANPGQSPKLLNKVASGGELSRIALALQVAMLDKASVATMVFDEIDVGIGGRVAEIVGQQLAQLGERRQILCITHLAQVAARARQQVNISKGGDPVQAMISTLDEDGRIEELARMMGGIEITGQTRAHAREMLQRDSG
jgi:DNA repair protein RecN (Recombination protein N)